VTQGHFIYFYFLILEDKQHGNSGSEGRTNSSTASRGYARGHEPVMDRPEAKGGTNAGMMVGEAMLNGLGGCFMSNLLAAAGARNIELKDVFPPIRCGQRSR
jgi:organic hydroperoxide reductase OsmC/OhrA